jgi:hypothetical protein
VAQTADVFLSYSREDKARVLNLAKVLLLMVTPSAVTLRQAVAAGA